MSAKKTTLLLFIIFAIIYLIKAQDKVCTMPDRNTKSICIRLSNCAYFQDQFRKYGKSAPQSLKDEARMHLCAPGNYVCCPDNVITTTSEQPTTVYSLFDDETNLQISQITNIDYNALNMHKNNRLINNRACGMTITQRIINGEIVSLNEIPWAVLLGYKDERDILFWNCGGNLINEKFVLTAAHCVNQDLYLARLGEHTISTSSDCNIYNDCVHHQDILIEDSIVHDGYLRKFFKNDIALLKLASPANLIATNIKTICLPVIRKADIETYKTEKFTISGWGFTETGRKSDILLKSTVKLFDIQVCKDSLTSASNKVPVHDENICAGGNSKLHACRGDSGGGLTTSIAINNKPRTYLYGLLARGIDCNNTRTHQKEYPDVYINIKYYLEWILDNMS